MTDLASDLVVWRISVNFQSVCGRQKQGHDHCTDHRVGSIFNSCFSIICTITCFDTTALKNNSAAKAAPWVSNATHSTTKIGKQMCCLIMCYSLLEVRGSCPPATRSRNKIVQKKTSFDQHRQSHTGCILFTFLQCEFSNVSSNGRPAA